MVLPDLLTVQRCGGGEDTGGGVQVEVQAGHSHLQRHCYQTILILIWVLHLDLEDKEGKDRRGGGHRNTGRCVDNSHCAGNTIKFRKNIYKYCDVLKTSQKKMKEKEKKN